MEHYAGIDVSLESSSVCVGYRRLLILLRREGEPSGINRIYRLYRKEELMVRKRRVPRRAVGARAPIMVEARVNAPVAGLRARPVRGTVRNFVREAFFVTG